MDPEDRTTSASAKGSHGPGALDLRGLKCPLPAIRTQKALGRMEAGAELVVMADDPLARLDVTHLCREDGHALDGIEPLATGGWRFRIRAGAARA